MMGSGMFTEATMDDCEAVAALAAKTFTESFGHLYRPENLVQHLATTCSADYFRESLRSGDTLLMLHDGDALIGYGKVGQMRLPYQPVPRGAQEIHRVYIDRPYQGRGLGKALMFELMALPRITTASAVFLSVWEENITAQALYHQYGFKPVGKYLYQVGDQYDQEIIMARLR